ncbi:hypothetical protein HYZ76_02240 [Candidatus Falkowbacteria bacterium]|nr:hypothetical protein [Candidatus Falkowbacteria bacterium]
MFKEEKRQSIHILFFLGAFLLKYLNKWQAVLLILLILFIIVFLLPELKVRSHVYRLNEKRYSRGAVYYFLILLVLVIIFPLEIVAITWAILALGDGTATLLGQHFKARELFWNKNKTYVGSLSFVIFASLGAFILIRWMYPEISGGAAFLVGLKTALVAAVVESLPLRLNDNISVSLVSAIILSFLLS